MPCNQASAGCSDRVGQSCLIEHASAKKDERISGQCTTSLSRSVFGVCAKVSDDFCHANTNTLHLQPKQAELAQHICLTHRQTNTDAANLKQRTGTWKQIMMRKCMSMRQPKNHSKRFLTPCEDSKTRSFKSHIIGHQVTIKPGL